LRAVRTLRIPAAVVGFGALANGEERDYVRTLTKAAACAVAIGAIAVVATGCGESTTSYNAPTVSNSAIQTDSSGHTISAPNPSATPAGTAAAAGCGKPVCNTTLKLDTDATALAFVPTSLTAPPGKITIVMKNDSAIPHSVAIDAPGAVAGQIVNQGGTSTATATLKAGSYQYYCTVPGHKAAGMVGTLTVTG
jgi:plastocyanin